MPKNKKEGFGKFLKEFERKKERLDVKSYELSMKTLEDIYKNVERDEMNCAQEVERVNEAAVDNYVGENEEYNVSEKQIKGT